MLVTGEKELLKELEEQDNEMAKYNFADFGFSKQCNESRGW